MSIVIEGMDIPSSCAACPCLKAWGCAVTWKPVPSSLLELEKPDWCPIHEYDQTKINIFDQIEEHPNCTVQILKNSVTGEISVGWYPNE